jgi:hypothetical protein
MNRSKPCRRQPSRHIDKTRSAPPQYRHVFQAGTTTRPQYSRTGRDSGSSLHLVQGADEQTARRRRAVPPLHLPEVRVPACHEVGEEIAEGCSCFLALLTREIRWHGLSLPHLSERPFRALARGTFWNSRGRGLRPRCLGQFQLSFSLKPRWVPAPPVKSAHAMPSFLK